MSNCVRVLTETLFLSIEKTLGHANPGWDWMRTKWNYVVMNYGLWRVEPFLGPRMWKTILVRSFKRLHRDGNELYCFWITVEHQQTCPTLKWYFTITQECNRTSWQPICHLETDEAGPLSNFTYFQGPDSLAKTNAFLHFIEQLLLAGPWIREASIPGKSSRTLYSEKPYCVGWAESSAVL